jgi:RNA polymerase sigma-70 factor (ECF subfamily)
MHGSAPANPSEVTQRLAQAAAGDRNAWAELLMRDRDRLRSMVALRLDRRLRGRVDPSDILQDGYMIASNQLEAYLHNPKIPFFLWLRSVVGQRLVALHRHHLGTQGRDAAREISLFGGGMPEASSEILAARLEGTVTGPSQQAIRAELSQLLQEALDRLDPLDREVVALRHFEQLNNTEVAQVLGLGESAASKRYVRALEKLK